MKNIKKFENYEDPKVGDLTPGPMGYPPSVVTHVFEQPTIRRKLTSEFEEKSEGYAKIILNSPEYMSLVDMAKDMVVGDDGGVEMQVGIQGPREDFQKFVKTFKDFFPSFVPPEVEHLSKGMKIPFYGRTKGSEGDGSLRVDFFRYLISKIQKPGYKL